MPFVDKELTREQIHAAAIYTEILSIFVFIIYVSCLDYIQFDFAEKYDKQSVEMRDFTVITCDAVTHPLPASFKKHKDQISLKYAIWS